MDNIIFNYYQAQPTSNFSVETLSVIIAAMSVIFAAVTFIWNLLSIRKKILIGWLEKIESDLQAFDINFLDHFRLCTSHIVNNAKLKNLQRLKISNENKPIFHQILLQIAEESISYAKRELPGSFKVYKIAEYNIRWDYPVSYHFFDKIRRMLFSPIEVIFKSGNLEKILFSIYYEEMQFAKYSSELEYLAVIYNKILDKHSKVLDQTNLENIRLKIAQIYYLYLNHIHKGCPYRVWRISRRERRLCKKYQLDKIDESIELTFEKLLMIKKKHFNKSDYKKLLLLWDEARKLIKKINTSE